MGRAGTVSKNLGQEMDGTITVFSLSCFGTSFSCFLFFWEGYFVLGRDGTEEFVPGHLLLPLSRDKGTPGQDFFLSQDKGTAGRPVPWKR